MVSPALTVFFQSAIIMLPAFFLIYSVQTESFDPASSKALAYEYGKIIVKEMVKHQVLIRKEPVAKDGH